MKNPTPQKYKNSCDHDECRASDSYGKAVTVYDFPQGDLYKFGDVIRTYCRKHFESEVSK